MRKLRVLAVIDHLGGGGAEKQFSELVTRLNPERYTVRVYLSEGGGMRIPVVRASAVELTSWSAQALEPQYSGRRSGESFRELKRQMREFQPDVVVAWLSYSITLSAAAAALTGTKRLVFSERSSLEIMFREEVSHGWLKKKLLQTAFSRARFVVTNTRSVAEEFLQFGYCTADQGRVVYNGLDLERFASLPSREELRRTLGLEAKKLYGVFVGKFVNRKGLPVLVEALQSIEQPEQGFEMLALGAGDMEDMLRRSGQVTVLGYRSNATEFIRAADFLVLPSLYEGLPNVVLEAMAVGTPSIATAVHGAVELLRDGEDGLLVPVGDAAALRQAMQRMMDSAELRERIAAGGLRRIQDFAMQRMIEHWGAVIEDAAEDRRKGRFPSFLKIPES